LIVLIIRSFLFEPFRIPSESMMPGLIDGDFIFVSKFAYGLRLPVVNSKVLSTGRPQRGDVIVFRLPKNPSVNYILPRKQHPDVAEGIAHAGGVGANGASRKSVLQRNGFTIALDRGGDRPDAQEQSRQAEA
jgi:signal peptidase I